MKAFARVLKSVCLVSALAVAPAATAGADVITRWNEQVFALGGTPRMLTMVHVAMFDAVNAIEPRYQSYLRLPAPPSNASAEAAAAAAAYGVLIRLLPGQATALNATLALSLAAIPDGPGKTLGLQFGDAVARQMYERNRRSFS